MARTPLTMTVLPTRAALRTAGVIVTMNVPDVVNGNSFKPTGAEVLFIQNTSSGAQSVTITSTPDPTGAADATRDIVTLAAFEYAAIGIIRPVGFIQSDGTISVDASATTVKIGVLSLPQN